MKKEKSVMTKLRKGSNPFFFNTAQNLILHGNLLYQVTHGLQRRRIFPTSEPR